MLSVGQEFDTFAEFEAVKKAYEDSKYVKWVVNKSSSIATANKRLRRANPDTTNLYKESLMLQNVEYTCKHGGITRIGTGKGIRPLQSTYKLECPAKLHMIATRSKLVVKVLKEEHNHDVTEANYLSLPENRKVDPEGQDKARLLFEGGVKPSMVRALLRDQGSGRVNARDLANLRQKWKKEKLDEMGTSDEERLVTSLENLLECDPDTSITIGKDEEDNLKFLLIVTTPMKRNVANFGKVLILDHTYKINRNRMPVCVLMVMDGNGAGRSAGYAFVANEQQTTVTEVLSAFRNTLDDGVADKIRTVIMDKDPSEINAAQTVFPLARIHLCLFHVSKVFKEKISSYKENEEVKEAIELLKYADSEVAFQEAEAKLKACASEEFWRYYSDNWKNIPLAWSHRDKKDSVTFGNSTTNRVENHNSKIKTLLSYNTTITDAVEGLLNLVQNKEEDVFYRDTSEILKKTYLTNSSNPVYLEILRDMTKYSARLLIWELENTPNDEELHHYKATEDSCSCVHRWSYELPCRHMFQCRRKLDLVLYEKKEIDAMWLKKHNEFRTLNQQSSGSVRTVIMPKQLVPKSHNDKFKMAMQTAKEICSVLGGCGTNQFLKRMEILKLLLSFWANGKEVTVTVQTEQSRGKHIKSGYNSRWDDGIIWEVQEVHEEEPQLVEIQKINNEGLILEAETASVNSNSNLEVFPSDKLQEISPSIERLHEQECQQVAVLDRDIPNSGQQLDVMENLERETDLAGSTATQTASNADLSMLLEDNENLQELVSLLNRVESGELIAEEVAVVSLGLTTEAADNKDSPSNNDVTDCVEPAVEPPSPCETIPDNPLCLCSPRKPTTRYIAGPDSRRPGRPYYACNTRSCKFFRMAASDQGVKKNLFSSPFKLPVCVKTKGRPKGAGKTTVAKTVQKVTVRSDGVELKKPDGACVTPFQLARRQGEKIREKKGSQIDDKDVSANSDGTYIVRSQSSREKSYTVTRDTCTCPDKINRKGITCKHMVKIRNLLADELEVQPLQTIAVVEDDPTTCRVCKEGEPHHYCIKCTRRVHAIEPCSLPTPGGDEGYGKGRVCKRCFDTPVNPRKRAPDCNLDDIALDSGPSQSQKSRSGRVIQRKLPYTPSKK